MYYAGSALSTADVDGDGVDEIVVLSGLTDGLGAELSILGGLTERSGPALVAPGLLETLPQWATLRQMGDLDGDGDDELLYTTESGLQVSDVEAVDAGVLAPVGEAFELPLPPNTGVVDGSIEEGAVLGRLTTAVGDLNGDGRVDVAAAVSWLGVGSVSDGATVAVWSGPLFRSAGAPDAPVPTGEPEAVARRVRFVGESPLPHERNASLARVGWLQRRSWRLVVQYEPLIWTRWSRAGSPSRSADGMTTTNAILVLSGTLSKKRSRACRPPAEAPIRGRGQPLGVSRVGTRVRDPRHRETRWYG